jgi:hypothetical protein
MDLGKGMRVMAASLSVGESSEHTSVDSIARNPHCRDARRRESERAFVIHLTESAGPALRWTQAAGARCGIRSEINRRL